VNTHFGFSSWTLAGLIACSAGWLQVLFRFCPAIRHWSDRDSRDWLWALGPATKKGVLIKATFASNTLRFFMGMFMVFLEIGAITLIHIRYVCTSTHTPTAYISSGQN
jgi:hypothetical protein